jgi:hypothetical protein
VERNIFSANGHGLSRSGRYPVCVAFAWLTAGCAPGEYKVPPLPVFMREAMPAAATPLAPMAAEAALGGSPLIDVLDAQRGYRETFRLHIVSSIGGSMLVLSRGGMSFVIRGHGSLQNQDEIGAIFVKDLKDEAVEGIVLLRKSERTRPR